MLTPQDLQQISFDKVRFGGYDMKAVDDLLEPLIQDYLTLYNENAVLKSKMRLLVDKLEEYRSSENRVQGAVETARKTCDDMVAQAEKKCAAMLAEAEENARRKSQNVDLAVGEEEGRLSQARAATLGYVTAVENEIKRQMQILQGLRAASQSAAEAPVPAAEPETTQDSSNIADEIEQNVERIMGGKPAEDLGKTRVMPPLHSDRFPDKFADLQFGRNYEINP